jgi:hypothetical protein
VPCPNLQSKHAVLGPSHLVKLSLNKNVCENEHVLLLLIVVSDLREGYVARLLPVSLHKWHGYCVKSCSGLYDARFLHE